MSDTCTISFLIGNGFDIAILKSLDKSFTTTYGEFYDYLAYFLTNKENDIYKAIDKKKKQFSNNENETWKDYELLLKEVVSTKLIELEQCTDITMQKKVYSSFLKDWKEIQYTFASFLNHVITPQTLMDVTDMDGKTTLQKFLGDLPIEEYKNIEFPQKTNNHIKIDYHIFNFNYSTLADNYFYWLFDYHPFNVSNNNSHFYPNPSNISGGKTSTNSDTNYFIRSSINFHHPHGQLSIPESILFGMSYNEKTYYSDNSNFKGELSQKLDKAYWSMHTDKVKPFMQKTDLFVIFGHSIGESDQCWWEEIIDQLKQGSELIIYDYEGKGLKKKILHYCKDDENLISDRIFVIDFDETKHLKYSFKF